MRFNIIKRSEIPQHGTGRPLRKDVQEIISKAIKLGDNKVLRIKLDNKKEAQIIYDRLYYWYNKRHRLMTKSMPLAQFVITLRQNSIYLFKGRNENECG